MRSVISKTIGYLTYFAQKPENTQFNSLSIAVSFIVLQFTAVAVYSHVMYLNVVHM